MRFALLTAAAVLSTFAFGCTVTTTNTGGDPPGTIEPPATEPPATEPPATEPPKADLTKPPSVKLDPGFAGGTGIADASNDIQSAAPGAQGMTYVALRKAGGSLGWGNGTLLRRYLADGTLDKSFATQGELDTKLVANPQALELDSTGRILVGGTGLYDPDTTSDTGREIVVVRATSAGIVDTTYGISGRAKLVFSPANVWTTSLRVRTDGSAFVAVWGRTSGNESYGSFLVGPSGSPLEAYGPNGFRTSPFPTDGAVALGGDVAVPTTAGLARFGADGAVKGYAIEAGVIAAKTAKDGSFVGKSFKLARFSAAGAKDTAFAGPTVSEGFADFAILPDGSVLVSDAGDLSWVSAKGGAATVVVKAASAAKLATTTDGKLLVTTSGSSAKVQRYVF
jgi:hypothetical protein